MAVRALGVATTNPTDAATKSYVDGLLGVLPVTTITSATSAAVNFFYICDTTSGAFTLTLPGAPVLGSMIRAVNSSTNLVTVSRSSLDTIIADGITRNSVTLGNGQYIELIYTTSSQWTVSSATVGGLFPSGAGLYFTNLATVKTAMSRDLNGRSQVVDPFAAADIATKNYADGLGVSTATVSTVMRRDANGRSQVIAPSVTADIATKGYVDGLWILPRNIISTNTTATVGNLYYVNVSGGSVTVTLPTTPANASRIDIGQENFVTANTVTILAGGSDHIDTPTSGTASLVLSVGQYVSLVYGTALGEWYVVSSYVGSSATLGTGSFTSAPNVNAAMQRDSAGRAQVVDPSAAADIATKNYVDTHPAVPPGDQLLLTCCFR